LILDVQLLGMKFVFDKLRVIDRRLSHMISFSAALPPTTALSH
jgi:hypothetical protein